MKHLIDKDALVAEIERKIEGINPLSQRVGIVGCSNTIKHLMGILSFIDTLEVKEVNVWKTVNNTNIPQADRNKIYCVFTTQKYILAKVINNPRDEDLLQWKCTEFPHHRYDMCEGDKYMQIV